MDLCVRRGCTNRAIINCVPRATGNTHCEQHAFARVYIRPAVIGAIAATILGTIGGYITGTLVA